MAKTAKIKALALLGAAVALVSAIFAKKTTGDEELDRFLKALKTHPLKNPTNV